MKITDEDIRAISVSSPKYKNEAKRDIYRALSLLPRFAKASESCGIPTSLLCAIASRESGIGKTLDVNGYGDGGHAFGIMQIDYRFHSLLAEKPMSYGHILQAGLILMKYIISVLNEHSWPRLWCIRGGVAAYNFGLKNVRTMDRLDVGTTRNNYSEDVICRAQFYCDFI